MRDATGGEPRPGPVRPAATPAPRQASAIWRSLPTDVKVLVVVGGLVVTGGVGWGIFGPQRDERMPALLGYVDHAPPAAPKRPAPPFKLPWWR
jgi:hypothetical protein